MSKQKIEETLDSLEEEVEETVSDYESPAPFLAPNWSDMVMENLKANEQQDGYPTCDGLRRLVELFIGPIIERRVTVHQVPKDKSGTATVSVTVTCCISNENHPAYTLRLPIVEECVADCSYYNTAAPFNLHLTATAESRAEARCYRKMLRLKNVVSAEEVANVPDVQETDWKPNDPIGPEQITAIDNICSKANMDVEGFVNSGSKQYPSIYGIPQSTASEMIQYANSIMQGKKMMPNGVGKYNPAWREGSFGK